MPILDVEKLSKRFGGLVAVDNLNTSIEEGEIVGLIGPNGAGKTTVFNLLAGFHKPNSGRIIFNGKNIAGMSPYNICTLGLARTFQVTRAFGDITILENVMVGVFARVKNARKARAKALEILETMEFSSKKDILPSELTAVDHKRLEISRALATEPELILLDEPMAGLTPTEKQELVKLLIRIRNRGKTLLIVEHDMKEMMSLCEHIILLDFGKKLVEGTPEEVAYDPQAISAYLGDEYVAT